MFLWKYTAVEVFNWYFFELDYIFFFFTAWKNKMFYGLYDYEVL